MNSKFQFEAIGTHWEIDLYSEESENRRDQIYQKILDLIEEFDRTYSRFREDSLVVQMSKKAGTYTFPENFKPLISLYEKMYKLTGGLVTPLIGSVMEEAGYDKTYSLKSRKLNRPLEWDEVIKLEKDSGPSYAKASAGKQARMTGLRMTIKKPVLLDFGAAGKGYLIDLVGELLHSEKIDSFCIDAGGDIVYRSEENKPITIGLENPANTEQVIGSVNLLNQSICGSAGNRRKWGEFHHIMNPKTLKPVDEIAAVWVIAESGLIADALSTALFFVEPEVLERGFQFEYVILNNEFKVRISDNFNGELFYN